MKGKVMYPRTEYEMTEEQLKKLLDACTPVPAMMIGNCLPSSPQENANRAWRALGEEMGFDTMTVRPNRHKGQRFFSAVPNETELQRKERLEQEDITARKARIDVLVDEITVRQTELCKLEEDSPND